MRGAFIAKADDEELNLRLFAQHSVLVAIARQVVRNLTQSDNLIDQDASFFDWLEKSERGEGAHRRKSQC